MSSARTSLPLAGLALLMALSMTACGPKAPAAADAALALDRALGDQQGDEQFLKVTSAPQFSFPEDHGAHPDYRQEWWYFTGNLSTPQGRRFGYQATIFRFALGARGPEATSSWSADQLYMAHLAVSDLDGGRFEAVDRFARGGTLGLAGAQTEPWKVWVEDWSMTDTSTALGAADTPFAVALDFQDAAIGIDLRLVADRPVVRQGTDGYSRKGDDPSNASAYYSITRLRTEGTIRAGGQRYSVSGASWFDREWGTSFLAPGVAGWDWFSLQLDDGRDLMFYRLRSAAGESTPWSAGTLAAYDAQGRWQVRALKAEQVQLEVGEERWRSAQSGVEYPLTWTLRVPDQALELEVRAALPDQELRLATRYWEGAVTVQGLDGDRPVSGRGYLELAGY